MMNILLTVIGIVIGALLFMRLYPLFAYRFIDKARNVVHNEVLRNQVKYKGRRLKRLFERNPKWGVGGWHLLRENNKDHGYLMERDGFIAYNTYSKLQFYWWFLTVWMWCDDDSNAGNTDIGYIGSLIGVTQEKYQYYDNRITERSTDRSNHYFFRWFRTPLTKAWARLVRDVDYGNAFDLGDERAKYTLYEPLAIYAWAARNPIYNLKYWFNV
jgi:hypothetical protein